MSVQNYMEARGSESPAGVKCYPTEFKFDADTRMLKGYASLFDVMDSYGDVMNKGAFTKTILKNEAYRPSRIKNLYQHNPSNPIGIPEVLQEDSTGLYMESRMGKTRAIDEYMELLDAGIVDGLSIGFNLVKAEPFVDEELSSQLEGWFKGSTLYNILEVSLKEVSLVTFPAVAGSRAVYKSTAGWAPYHRKSAPYVVRGVISNGGMMAPVPVAKAPELDFTKALELAQKCLHTLRA